MYKINWYILKSLLATGSDCTNKFTLVTRIIGNWILKNYKWFLQRVLHIIFDAIHLMTCQHKSFVISFILTVSQISQVRCCKVLFAVINRENLFVTNLSYMTYLYINILSLTWSGQNLMLLEYMLPYGKLPWRWFLLKQIRCLTISAFISKLVT